MTLIVQPAQISFQPAHIPNSDKVYGQILIQVEVSSVEVSVNLNIVFVLYFK